jgi:hypothetical protein
MIISWLRSPIEAVGMPQSTKAPYFPDAKLPLAGSTLAYPIGSE